MNCYIIIYDIKDPDKYEQIYEHIKKYGTWAHINESTWAIKTDNDAKTIRDSLKKKLDDDDSVFVVRSGTEAAWSNVLCTNEWLRENL